MKDNGDLKTILIHLSKYNPLKKHLDHIVVADDNGIVVAGHHQTAIAGDRGTAIVGEEGLAITKEFGIAIASYKGKAAVGSYGKAFAGERGQAYAGDNGLAWADMDGIARAGEKGEIHIRYWDTETRRTRTKVGYIGEDGLKFNTPYYLNDRHEFEEVNPSSAQEAA